MDGYTHTHTHTHTHTRCIPRYKAAFELFKRGGMKYPIDNVFLWNVVSWDVQVRQGRGPCVCVCVCVCGEEECRL